jgi:hypothetical protein
MKIFTRFIYPWIYSFILLVIGTSVASADTYSSSISFNIDNTNSSVAYNNYPFIVALNNTQLISLGYLSASGLDTQTSRITTLTNFPSGLSTSNLTVLVDQCLGNRVNTYAYKFGYVPPRTSLDIITGSGGSFNVNNSSSIYITLEDTSSVFRPEIYLASIFKFFSTLISWDISPDGAYASSEGFTELEYLDSQEVPVQASSYNPEKGYDSVGAPDVYWVGRTGVWSNLTCWSYTSGGPGGIIVAPNSTTNAHFDVNSFNAAGQVVTVDAAAYCLNMDWTGATNTPTLAFGINSMYIYGNVVLIAAMNTTMVDSYMFFRGTGKTFTSNGHSLGVRFYPLAGSITLTDNLITTEFIVLYGGTFNTGNFSITGTNFIGHGVDAKTLTLGTSVITLSGTTGWSFPNTGLTLTDNTHTIILTGASTFAGGVTTSGSYGTVNLNGTAHTISGSNTFVNLTRAAGGLGISTYTITAGSDQGTGYVVGDTITVTQAGAAVGQIRVLTVGGSGEIATSSLLVAGAGYSVANDLATTGGTGTGCLVNITAVTAGSKTDTLTLTYTSTQTVSGVCQLLGSSVVNRVLVQSNYPGATATINAAATTGTNNVDFMDITGTGAATWDLSAVSSGDCGGNVMKAITPVADAFTPAVAQSFTNVSGNN